MATASYMNSRKQYHRPQGLLLSNNPGTLDSGFYVPEGYEFGIYDEQAERFVDPDWMVLTDNNRREISLSYDRIEERKRMVNGRMRSIHVADKLKISCTWEVVPSRAFDFPQGLGSSPYYTEAAIDASGNWSTATRPSGAYDGIVSGGLNPDPPPTYFRSWNDANFRFTTDGGAGGADMLLWYKTHPGSFYLFLAYDNFHNFNTSGEQDMWGKLRRYNERVEVFFSDFSYTVQKRGQRFDLWNVSLSLEEA